MRTLRLRRVRRRMRLLSARVRFVQACVRSGRRAVPVYHCGSGVIGRIAGKHASEVTGRGCSLLTTRRDNRRTDSIGSVFLQVMPSRETAESSVQQPKHAGFGQGPRGGQDVTFQEGYTSGGLEEVRSKRQCGRWGRGVDCQQALHRSRTDAIMHRGQLQLCRPSRGHVCEQGEGQESSERGRSAKRISRVRSSRVIFLHPVRGCG
eukprot:6189247-Pleurochrysis_carterae.AAC.4